MLKSNIVGIGLTGTWEQSNRRCPSVDNAMEYGPVWQEEYYSDSDLSMSTLNANDDLDFSRQYLNIQFMPED